MVVLSKIYTRTGDRGETALGDGARVSKASARVAAYGTVDELNAVAGLAREHADGELDLRLSAIQQDLFDLGADLCKPISADETKGSALRMVSGQVERIEREIDEANRKLQPLRSFILPGGTPLSSRLHMCRTVARRAERLVVELAQCEEINPQSLQYLNRLSDWFFVQARLANDGGSLDVLWIPGANRTE
ncbi:MAG: cob(I)yrinic acid a,c-diamide adenosyltransferase [Rhodobacteraceae bacterium]|nr:cob(I)yrinic acid a,c-diamide adenosyltransferase [Paracoccaceae bacterium]